MTSNATLSHERCVTQASIPHRFRKTNFHDRPRLG
jgi:hypothetical protein